MSKELEALKSIKGTIIYSSRGNWGFEYRYVSDIELIKKDFDIIEQALNDLEDANHNYKALEEMHNNSVTYATKIQNELNELRKRNEPMKIKHENNGLPYCSSCERTYLRNTSGNENNYCGYCGQKLDWSDEK